MKIASIIARLLLGLMFLVFGLNGLLNFIPTGPLPTGHPGEFFAVMFATHYFYAVGVVMTVSAILLLINRYVALGLTFLGPVLVNILLFHLFMQPKTIGPGVFVTLLWLLVAWQHRAAVAGLFKAQL